MGKSKLSAAEGERTYSVRVSETGLPDAKLPCMPNKPLLYNSMPPEMRCGCKSGQNHEIEHNTYRI